MPNYQGSHLISVQPRERHELSIRMLSPFHPFHLFHPC